MMISSIFHPNTVIFLMILANWQPQVDCHGYLSDPPARTSAWRYGFKTPKNYNDMEMFCGGLKQKIQTGKCGICGDPFKGPRDSEVGGKWVTKPPTIVATYKSGQWITVKPILTARHGGYHEFRICPAVSDTVEVTEDCLNKHTLEVKGSKDKKYMINRKDPIQVKLPTGMTCKRCVFQWDYTANNNWGKPPAEQETFRGCADVKIT
ncbi:uncharacterized protein LOC141851785 [Brevipalpus obovatus]|uniref:uncharacterized protein LOC141851785 n=1 Tax=Brevipalpus obovatus TaxID=246614 RepID=UPI003D9F666C